MTTARIKRSEDSTSEDRSIANELEHAAPELESKAKDLLDSGKEHLQNWKDGALDAVRNRPIRSMLIFVAVGALMGVLIGRRGN